MYNRNWWIMFFLGVAFGVIAFINFWAIQNVTYILKPLF